MRTGLFVIVIGTLVLGAVVGPYTREFLAVDRCLDGGGSFDYAVGDCDHKENHPYVPFAARHPAAAPAAVGGVALILIGLFLGKRRA